MKFNVKKSMVMVIGKDKMDLKWNIDGEKLEVVEKHLGILGVCVDEK